MKSFLADIDMALRIVVSLRKRVERATKNLNEALHALPEQEETNIARWRIEDALIQLEKKRLG